MDVTIGGAADYNAVATRDGWHSICDPTLQFAHPELVKLLDLWRANAGESEIGRAHV